MDFFRVPAKTRVENYRSTTDDLLSLTISGMQVLGAARRSKIAPGVVYIRSSLEHVVPKPVGSLAMRYFRLYLHSRVV